MNRSDGEIDRLLARGALGGAAREEILEQVLGASPEAARKPARRRLWLGGAALALSAAAALVLVVRPAPQPEYRAKGAATGAPALDVGCPPASLEACPAGSILVFSVLGAKVTGHLQAWAEPDEGTERIWYLSAETQTAALPPAVGTQPAGSGVRIGPEHQPGRYLIHVVFSTSPLSRPRLLAGNDPAELTHATFPLTVVAPR
jgi:hypothetical protein